MCSLLSWTGRRWATRWALLLGLLSPLALAPAAGRFVLAAEPDREELIAEVKVVGNRSISTAKILSMIRTRAGAPLDWYQLQEDQRRLVASRWFQDVGIELLRQPHGLVVIFRVLEANPIRSVRLEGNTIFKEQELLKMAGLDVEGPADGAFLHEAARKIEAHYRSKGFSFATVEVVQGQLPGDQQAVLRITEGPRARLKEVHFVGNAAVSSMVLKTKIMTKPQLLLLFRGKYDSDQIDQDVHRIAAYYRSLGYFDVQVSREVQFSEDHRQVTVTFFIAEGLRYLVRSIHVQGNTQLSVEEILPEPGLKAGDYFTERALNADLKQIRKAYGQRGYVEAKIRPELKFSSDPGYLDVVFQIEEGRPYRVGRIDIVGNEVTRDRVIRRQVRLYPGEILNTELLEESERRLRRTQLFQVDQATGTGPTISMAGEGPNLRDLIVQVREGPTGRIMFGVGFNTDAGLVGNLLISERNFDITRPPSDFADLFGGRAFRGGGQEFRLELAPGTEVSRYLVSWREPMLFDLPYSLGVAGYFFQRNYREWDEQRGGGRLSLGHEFTNTVRGALSLRLEDILVDDPDVPTPPDLEAVLGHNLLAVFTAQLEHDTLDNVFLPSSGHLYELSFDQGVGDFVYPKVSLEGRHYWTVYERPDGTGKQVFSVRGLVGIAGEETPIFERFYAGGFKNFRGFEFRGIGPKVFDVHVGGDFLLLGSLEYLFPLTADEVLRAVVFTDFGTLEEDVEITDFRVTAGVGLRVALPFLGPMPLALDLAVPLHKADTDEEQLVSFFFGFVQ